jgi:Flp pilus assembly protein TadD
MKVMSRLLPFILLAMILIVPVYGQTGAVTGKVLDADGKPMAGVTVTIDRKEISQHFEVKTSKDGGYIYNGIPAGTYKIAVMKDGQLVTGADNIHVGIGGQTPVDFDLRKVAAAAPAAGGADDAKAKNDAARKNQAETKAAFDAGLAAMATKNPDGTPHTPDFPTAIQKLQEASTLDPTQHVIFAQLGGALDGAKKYADSADAYKKAIELKPDEARYYNNLGIELGKAGKVDDAAAALQKSAELDPTSAGQAYFNLGAVLVNGGHTKEAAAAFQKAIDVKPDMNEAYYQLGISLMGDTTKVSDSMVALQKYVDLQKTGANVDVAKQLIDALKAQAPATYTNPDTKSKTTKGKTPSPKF